MSQDVMEAISRAVAQGQSTPDILIMGSTGSNGGHGAGGRDGQNGVNGRDAHCNWKTGCSDGSAGTDGSAGGRPT